MKPNLKPSPLPRACFAFLLLALSSGNALATTRYVSLASGSPTPPYTSWSTAATNIQDAVDASSPGDEVVVTNGSYSVGGRAILGTMTNRVAVDRPVFLHSVNGAEATVIEGYRTPGSGDAVGAIRCVYLTNGAALSGFTLTNGATSYVATEGGGGAFCETAAVISNCRICGNSATWFGGGVVGGSLTNCILKGNTAGMGGGAYASTLYACMLVSNTASSGGGIRGGVLNNSSLIGNSAEEGGGASADYGHGVPMLLNNCLVLSNTGTARGGGVSGFSSSGNLSLNNCTIIGNTSSDGGGIWMTNGSLNNCIIYYNTAAYGTNWDTTGGVPQNHCCTTPAPYSGAGSITNPPSFIALTGGNLRLQSNSPCINAGDNAFVAGSTDLDGRPRIVDGIVDIGAYESQSPANIWYQSSAPSNFWNSVASSADGTRLIAGGNRIYTSANSGQSWFYPNDVPATIAPWNSVASSGDGFKLAAVSSSSSAIFLSTNGGSTWFTNTLNAFGLPPLTAVCMSGDGTKLAVCASNLIISVNAGLTWTTNPPPYRYMGALVMSSNGKTIAWGSSLYPGAVFTSQDDGLTWKSNSMPFYVMGLAVSADGMRLASACLGQVIYTSTDSGTSWQTSSSPATSWKAITCSADGNTIVAAANNGSTGPIYTSADSGLTWAPNNAPNQDWKALAASADGAKLVAAASTPSSTPGPIFLSESWPSPKLQIVETNGSTVVSWTIPSQTFALQSSSNLLTWAPGTTVSTNYSLLQNGYSTTDPGAGFLRLIGL